jgi:hypothetical protein
MIKYLIEDPEAIGEMERISKSLGSREATAKIIELMKGLFKKKEKVSRIPGFKGSSEVKI